MPGQRGSKTAHTATMGQAASGISSALQRAAPATSRAERAERLSQLKELRELRQLPEQLRQAKENRKALEEQHARELDEAATRRTQLQQRVQILEKTIAKQPQLRVQDKMSDRRRDMTWYAAALVEYKPPHAAPLHLSHCWERLIRHIEQMSTAYFPMPMAWDSLAPAIQEKLVRVSPKAKQYLEDEEGFNGQFIFAAWIWRTLDEAVFSKSEGPWAGEHWGAYSQLQRLAAPLAAPNDNEWTIRYHIWRNLTVGMICHMTSEDETRVSREAIAKALSEEFGPLIHLQEGFTQSDLDQKLDSIAKAAVEADLCMHLDRMDWAVFARHPDTDAAFDFPFEPGERADGFKMVASDLAHPLEPEENILGRPVDLITVPLLRCRGWHDPWGGFGYDTVHYDDPMQVVVDQYPGGNAGDAAGG